MANIEEIISTLEKAAEDAVKGYKGAYAYRGDAKAEQRAAQASVLAAYAMYKVQEGTLVALKEQTLSNIQIQTSTINELREQAKWTKRLVIATFFLALVTLIVAIAAFFHR
jgi:hypothetical protein